METSACPPTTADNKYINNMKLLAAPGRVNLNLWGQHSKASLKASVNDAKIPYSPHTESKKRINKKI